MRPTKESLPQHLEKFHADISTECTNYGICQDKFDQRTATATDVNNFVVNMYDCYVEEEKTDIYLIRMFSEDFMDWHVKTWSKADIKIRRALSNHLEAHGFSAHSPEKSSDPSDNSSADNTFDDNHADAPDEDTSNASVECSAELAGKDTANFDDENSADFDDNDHADESDNIEEGNEPAKDLYDNGTTSLGSTESHNKEESLPEGFAHAKERCAGLILVDAIRKKKVSVRGIGA
ncbi:hypothetical protein E4U17_008134 [Claviceps sp. LM77 group G4]|nr:hypothetical protein E4U17_008134 [Claviceps sp. LM77 group G4]KAG6072074.1 hypothetical protein E4U16_005661 [Claviceps sp. LM84 group G4]